MDDRTPIPDAGHAGTACVDALVAGRTGDPWALGSIGCDTEAAHEAELLARAAHAGIRHRTGEPQVAHVLEVAREVAPHVEAFVVPALLWRAVAMGLLDTGAVRDRFGGDAAATVEALCPREGERFVPHVERVRTDPVARQVALAECRVGLSERELSALDPLESAMQRQRLETWRDMLTR